MQIDGNLSAARLLLRRRRDDAAALAVIAAFFTLMFAGQIFGGKFLLAGDPLYYSYPLRSVGWEMMRAGQLPLWTPLVLSGYPLLSMSQLAFAYPLTWGYLFLPGHWAEQIYVLAPFLLSPAFTYAYARETGRSRTAALLAGLAFGYGGMMCSGISFTGLPSNSMLWLPLLLIPVDRAARGRGRFIPLLCGATAAYAMSVLNGQGQSFLYTGIVAAAYGLYVSLFPPSRRVPGERGAHVDGRTHVDGEAAQDDGDAMGSYGEATREDRATRAGGAGAHAGAGAQAVAGARAGDGGALDGGRDAWVEPGWREWRRWRPLFVALGALMSAAGLAAFQILETMRAARRSIRNTLSYEAISTGAFTFKRAVGSVFLPLYYSTDVTAYLPPLALLCAALACFALVARRDGARDRRIYFWVGVAVVGWVLMLGANTPAQQVVYRLPLLNKFRVPSRHTFEWTFALSILAAYGWDIASARLGRVRAQHAPGRDGRRHAIEAAFAGLLLIACVVVGVYWWRAVQVAALAGTYDYTGLPKSTFLLWKLAFNAGVLLLIWQSARLAVPRARACLLIAAIALACFVEPSAAISRWYEGMLLTEERFRAVSPTTRFLQNYPPEENRVYTRVELYSEEFTTTPRLEAPNLTALHGIHNLAGYEPLIFERYSRALGGIGMDAVSPREGYTRNDQLFQPRSRVLDLLNTTFVVSFSNLGHTLQSLTSRDGVAFHTSDMQTALDPGKTITLGGGAATGDTLALVTSLSNAGEVEQGTVVARVRFQFSDEGGSGSEPRFIVRDLRAGVDTAEWAHERPDVRRAVRHALAPVFDARTGDEPDSYPAHRYLAFVPLGGRARVDKIEITNLTDGSPLAVWKASIHDTASKTSTPISSLTSEWWETVYQENHALILRNRRALPRAWLVAEAEAVDGEEALRRITGAGGAGSNSEGDEGGFDPRRTALLEVAPAELPSLPGGVLAAGSAARVSTYEATRVVVETSAPTATLLVLSEVNYPGWEARVDGAAVPIYATNYLLRGVYVPAGEHRVEMRYRAPAARNGAFISASTLIGLCLLSMFDWRARRRGARA
ncbi:MAG TPA: YfhO family protein [Pyrinomonadaceae bacterium]|nr:YfhO family protein [Pyrinomonadaceae bacterium]